MKHEKPWVVSLLFPPPTQKFGPVRSATVREEYVAEILELSYIIKG